MLGNTVAEGHEWSEAGRGIRMQRRQLVLPENLLLQMQGRYNEVQSLGSPPVQPQ